MDKSLKQFNMYEKQDQLIFDQWLLFSALVFLKFSSFFELNSVFSFFLLSSLLHVPAAEKNPVGAEKTVFRPFSGGEKTPQKKKKKRTRLVLLVTVR